MYDVILTHHDFLGPQFIENNLWARPDFFYFLVLGSADPIFSKTGIKIKLLSLNFIFFIADDRNFPPHSEIKYRTFFAGELCAGTPSRR